MNGEAVRRICVALVLGTTLTGCGVFEPPITTTEAAATATVGHAAATTGTAAEALLALPVKGRAPKTGYSREQFGQAWSDDVDVPGGHNGCDTRSDVLRRDLRDVTLKPNTHGCVPMSGTLHDPYTGTVIAFVRGESTSADVQIDHVVALSDAWQTGAQQLTAQERQNLANDPINLQATDGPTNQAKGDSDAGSWLPPDRAYRCDYVAIQIEVKTTYRLWVTPAEHDAMQTVLSNCPGQALPTESDQ